MANPSPFLPYQDKNGDFLLDDCEVQLPGPIEKVCLDCVPNPKAIVTDWRKSLNTPFLNEKLCLYQIGIQTHHSNTGGAELSDRFETFKEDAIELFLDEYEKDNSSKNMDILREGIFYDETKDFELEARANSRLSLLYSVPFDVLESLDPDEEEDEDDEREPVEVTYLASELLILLTRVRKGLNLYSRYVKYDSVMNGANLMFVKNRSPLDLKKYGDNGFGRRSELDSAVRELDKFLNNRGFNIAGIGLGFLKDRVIKITLGFNRNFKLKKLKVFSMGCREKPKVFKGRKIAALNRTEPFKDRTAMAYFAQLAEMERDLNARTPKNFVDFIKDYTFPKVEFFDSQEIVTDPSLAQCVADNARDKIAGIGQDILDDVLSIGDIIAYQFHKNICRDSEEEAKLREELGQLYRPVEEIALFDKEQRKKNKKERKGFMKEGGAGRIMGTMAKQQALETLEKNPNVFVRLCADVILNGANLGDSLTPRGLWDRNLNKIKICGLLDFLLEGLQCLWAGLELEEALAIALTSALRAMGFENFNTLFVGLPPEEQAELDALVKRKIAKIKQSASTPRTAESPTGASTLDSDNFIGEIDFVRPFQDPVLLEQEKASRTAGSYGEATVSKSMYEAQSSNFGTRPRVGTSYSNEEQISGRQSPAEDAIKSVEKRAQEINPDEIFEAYVMALIEYYSGRLLDLVDMLNQFPGAEIISKILATLDCPRPPLFTPSIMDFIKDIELPICRNIGDIALPRLFIPKFSLADLLKRLVKAIREAIIRLIIRILEKLMIKLCEVIGEAICSALETAGNIIGDLPSLVTGNSTFKQIVRDAICGPDASDEQVDDSIASMFELLGGAGGSLANREQILSFNEAIASSSTRQEIIDASLGKPSEQFLEIVDTIIEYEFPDLREAFPNKGAIGSFYQNFGNFLPEELKAQLEDFSNQTFDDLELPANPSLCATPEQLEEFCSVRAQILEGRATPEQIAQLCENQPTAENFEALNDILQDGIPATIMNNMPPLLSDPGCDNGLFPREPEELQREASVSLEGGLDSLKMAYSYDMLGNGLGQKNWGYMNLVLSDTMGRPFTNHVRTVSRGSLFFAKRYVDFYVDADPDEEDDAINYAALKRQRGAFPLYVAEWMPQYWNAATDVIEVSEPNNKITNKKSFRIESDDDITKVPDYGYNYKLEPTSNGYKVVRKPRKEDAEIVLDFRDNNGGAGESGTSYSDASMGVGYRLRFYFGEFAGQKNLKDGNVRVKITQRLNNPNVGLAAQKSLEAQGVEPEDADAESEFEGKADAIATNKKYEFLGIDGGLEDLLLDAAAQAGQLASPYPQFEASFEQKNNNNSPLIILLSEMLSIDGGAAKQYWKDTTTKMIEDFGSKIFDRDNNASYLYGATPDLLKSQDAEYGVVRGGNHVPYGEAKNGDGDPLSNNDSELGISKDQHDNGENARVFYLDPATFGGSYVSPKVYVKPLDNEGMLGLINTIFPELSPCKPQRTDLVDFTDIAAKISNSYNNYPDDPRLAGDPDCIVERPFDRVLNRAAKSGIEGTISAACRIYASVHFLKTINTFAKFKPDFKNNLSSMYASFILEDMEKGMMDSQSGFAELFNPFKDDEFWYAFLEQAVQVYFQRIQSGDIIDVPSEVERALEKIAEAQNKYDYPSREDLRDAKRMDEIPFIRGLNRYREDQNLAAVKSVEEHCKVILKEFMVEEVNFISDVFYENMVKEKFIDKDDYVHNLYYHILTDLTDGSALTLDQELKETVGEIPTGTNQYTDGNTLAMEDGTPYVGYYHTMTDDAGDLVFMAGEEHDDENEVFLRPFANKVSVNVGDINGNDNDPSKPFFIEKYIKLDGSERDYSQTLIDKLRENGDVLVSEKYPGTLEPIYAETPTPTEDNTGRPIVGLKGELGLRYGLKFYARVNGQKKLVASSEIDVLDLPLALLEPLQGDSKELLCLVNKLVDDPNFKLFMDYAIPARKILGALAIYNDVCYLDSIGQLVAEKGAKNSDKSKPGATIEGGGSDGWFHPEDRPSFTPFVETWDDWDRVTLRKSDAVLKRMFKSYYYSRDFGQQDEAQPTWQVVLNNLKEKFKFAPGARVVPRWFKQASNPFNAKGDLCEGKGD